jgi:hypothetical protein
MSPRLEALKYILQRASIEVDYLKVYIDDTIGMVDHQKTKAMIELARDILEEAMLP